LIQPSSQPSSPRKKRYFFSFIKWAKAVIFTEKGIVAVKDCNPKFDELSEYFKAYDSRDVTIGKGIF
jgi:hypothetical protein